MHSFQAQARRLVFIGMILVPIIPTLVIVLLGDWSMAKIIRRAAQLHMERIAEDHAAMIDAFLHERLNDLRVVLDTYGAEALENQETLETVLDRLRKVDPAFQDLGLITAEGVQAAYAGPYPLRGKDYRGSEWRSQAQKQGSYVSDVYRGFRDQPHFTAAVSDVRGDVLRATIDSEAFGKLVESVRLGQRGRAYVVDADGVLQTLSHTGPALLAVDPAAGLYAMDSFMTASISAETGQGEELFSVSPLKQGRWRLVVRQPMADAMGELATIRLYALALLVLGGLLVIPSAYILSRRVGDYLAKAERRSRELEDQLARAARLAELGTMTAGFAHEINNPLQVMTSDISLLELVLGDTVLVDKAPEQEEMEEISGIIKQLRLQIKRCAQITQAILRFGRREQTSEETIHLDTYFKDVAEMVRRKAEVHGIQLSVSADPDAPDIHADPGKLQQVLLNLLNNAVHAIVDRHGSEGGVLEMTAGPGRAGQTVIKVRDNGAGMTPETMSMIFTPFFTTKPRDQGTGLGLSLCYGLVESMGGSISVDSKPDAGTEFTIRLPAAS